LSRHAGAGLLTYVWDGRDVLSEEGANPQLFVRGHCLARALNRLAGLQVSPAAEQALQSLLKNLRPPTPIAPSALAPSPARGLAEAAARRWFQPYGKDGNTVKQGPGLGPNDKAPAAIVWLRYLRDPNPTRIYRGHSGLPHPTGAEVYGPLARAADQIRPQKLEDRAPENCAEFKAMNRALKDVFERFWHREGPTPRLEEFEMAAFRGQVERMTKSGQREPRVRIGRE
jgi:hypothetical protein